ncbi:sugar kinase [Microbacterium sp. KSW4-17]|uniref:Sugar kinase n=1 Tax=Microbacterium galbum TaxID=3075994 RepID=A0ABU3T561_9MICO|nr:sugar kinase [Microbacterium sp. KSW4-17]MDU0366508.1 sugar kinase [Microbacterium sp. KSW4-17]
MAHVFTLGEALATFFVDAGGEPSMVAVAGAELNTAVGVARLGHRSSWMSRLGDDAFAGLVRATLAAEGIDDRFVRAAPGEKTGLIVKQRLSDDLVRSEHYRVGSAASGLTAADFTADDLADVDLVHVSCITASLGEGPRALFERVVHEAAGRGVPVSLDTNHRPQLIDDAGLRDAVDDVIEHVDTLLCNEDEARVLTGLDDAEEAVATLLARGPRTVVVKLGRHGAVAGDAAGVRRSPAVEIPPPHHPVGAGDAFAAGWITAVLEGLPVDGALRRAAWCAARVVADPGDHTGFPSRDRLAEVAA